MNKLISNILLPTALMGTVTTMIVMPAQTTNSQVPIARNARPVTVWIQRVDNNPIEKDPGSGVIIAQEGNTYTVATAAHVISGAPGAIIGQLEAPSVSIIIKTFDDNEKIKEEIKVPATQAKFLLGKEENDLAVIQFTSKRNYKIAEIVNSDDVSLGSTVIVCGFPLSDGNYQTTWNMQTGTISAINKNDKHGYHFQYNAPTMKGMSGGPVFNQHAQVIAIHGSTLGSEVGGKEQGFNRGMPINILQREQKKTGLNLNLQIANTIREASPASQPPNITTEGRLKPRRTINTTGGTEGTCAGNECH